MPPITIIFNNGPFGPIQNAFSNSSNQIQPFTCGYQGDLTTTVPDNQLITITATSEASYGSITGILQKDFVMEVSSDWESFITPPGAMIEGVTQAISTLLGSAISSVNPVTSRRMWRGTTPIKLRLDIYFLSINDTMNEVVEPCARLQRICLPSLATTLGKGTINLPILSPPGPSPIDPSKGDQITISVGGLFTFNQVIIKSVSVTYDNKLDADALPISAIASIEIETYEILTKDKFSTAMNIDYPSQTATVPGTGSTTQTPVTPTTNTPGN